TSSCHCYIFLYRLENSEFTVRVYPGTLAEGTIYCPISARKTTSAAETIERVIDRLQLDRTKCYVLAEVKEFGGEEWILNPSDCPVQRMMLWPRVALEHRSLSGGEDYRFLLRLKNLDGSIHYGGSLQMWLQVTEERRRMVERGLLPQPETQGDHADLCCLPELTERSLLDNLRSRFHQEKIYTYVGSILIVINPFKFLPIYNPKYVKMYDNHSLGDLEPHIYAVADVAYHAMLQRQTNQCIVISGESGSGKTQSTNFLIHHLTALSQKGFASGVEQIILGAGPVLEAFGNAKTAHNNNSSRFGKFIQVNYQESGTVRGAYVEKYLLEKSRLVYQEHNERNYHVFYYLLAGASEEERAAFHLMKPEEYHYLSQMTKRTHRLHWDSYCESEADCFTVEGEDLKHDFERLQLGMEMVGFLPYTRKQIFSLLSAILHLGNIRYKRKTYRDDSIDICNPEVLPVVSELLQVKEEMLIEALTTRKTITVGEKLIVPYKLAEAGTVRDSMAKSLYSALFDWIVFRINHALLNIKDLDEPAKILSIGVLDIFGFEDYENNSFEQFCINFANERLQHYFNQHTFKLEQEDYRAEGISWRTIDYIDNTDCINLISKKPTALFHLLDEECNFPQATNQTLLDKFKRQHEGNRYIEFPAVMEPAFIIRHYAGKVKYGVKDFREKNTDHMRPDIVALLKSSKNAFICSLIGIDPSATFRWAVLRSYFRAVVAFREAGKRHTPRRAGEWHDDAAPCAVLNSVDSFSFLQHPVHQRSLEILQRCKEEKHSKATQSNSSKKYSHQERINKLLNVRQLWLVLYDRNSPALMWNGRVGRQSRLSSSSSTTDEDGIFVNSASSKLLERAHDILMRNKNYKAKPALPKHLLNVKSLKYLSNLTLHDRITKSLLHLHKKKKPPSISAQFQASLNKLMETLGQSEPYFVKCIRSNAEKLPLRFNDNLVLRQLRYTGMLETVRIRQSGYNVKYSFKDFVHHFYVLLPESIRTTREDIQHWLDQLDLETDGYQVGKTMVFLREAARQQLQAQLHSEVLRLIVVLQRQFRAQLERKHFLRMRAAAVCIQVCFLLLHIDQNAHGKAALCLQTHWRGYRERHRFSLWKEAALVLQRAWRLWLCQRCSAALVIQTAWRCHRAREAYLRLYAAAVHLQAIIRGHLARQRFRELTEQKLRERKDQLQNVQVNASSPTWHSEARLSVTPATVPVRDKLRATEELSQKATRAKRESRRMRELEQAKFSLELLKVRATCGESSPTSEERRWSVELVPSITPPLCSPQGTPDSQSSKGSFELLSIEDAPKATEEVTDSEDLCSPIGSLGALSEPSLEAFSISPKTEQPNRVPASDPGSHFQQQTEPAGYATHPSKLENYLPTFFVPANESSTVTPSHPNVPPEQNAKIAVSTTPTIQTLKERQESTRRPVVVVISMQKESPLSEELSELVRPCVEVSDTGSQRKTRGHVAQRGSIVLLFQHALITSGELQVGKVGHKKKARMSRTRSDFLTRAPILSVGGDSDEDDYDATSPQHSPVPLSKQSSTEEGLGGSCFSDSDMVTGPTDAIAGLGYVLYFCFFSPNPHSVETSHFFIPNGAITMSHLSGEENLSPRCSPDLTWDRGFRDLKENKEPSPKVKRRRSVKISSVAAEPIQWPSDGLQILTCTHDYRSMNDFLMKKINDLDTEDSKKDTMVDVVFKKALKEFRLNIFNSYSTALAMDDGKSIRYKDLYALFEQILEKTMRQEQRDWRESPVKVWVNTFKVFLDEFMTEYKPLDSTQPKQPKPERKKRRKKDADIVEEHHGHIFKSTQYSIPTYCEYCSSLIWMMDRACRYICLFEQFDPELSPRQFGVEVLRLTNDERTVPLVVEKLINYIEMHGLYTEGIYRKSGSTNKIRELKQGLDTGNFSMNLDDYNIHVIASVFKQWLRDLPSPLMTFELYEAFIRAMGLQDRKEMIRGVYSVVDQLSRTHLNTLERLIFHLVRIALQEETNRMSANALAIVFAPCILRCPDTIDPLQSVQDISKTTACVELVICEQMTKYKVRLKDINTLEFAENKAKCRLTFIRRSMGKGHFRRLSLHSPTPPVSPRLQSLTNTVKEESEGNESLVEISEHQQAAMEQEEKVLTEQIENLQKEKEELTFEMLTLEPRASDDETLESEASIGTADSSENLNVDSEVISVLSGMSDGKSPRHRTLRRQPDSLDSVDSSSSVSPYSSSSHFQPSNSPISNTSPSSFDSFNCSPTAELESVFDERPQFTSRGTFNPEKGKQKLRGGKHVSQRHTRESGGHSREPPDIQQQLVLYGSNEFMV
uniref:Myosin IXA n=1 Tax=Hippocampus comes TaxID=109280 RepID=A0A3Q2YMA6_HIPCM